MSKSKNSRIGIQTELSRDLGLTTALSIGIGTMIAAGIFTLSGLAIRSVGSAAILSFIISAVVAGFTALTYCEFVSIYPRSGEGYLYARETFTPPLAYLVGWALILGYTSSCAFYISSLSSYFHEFIWESPVEALSGLLFLIGLILLNIKGTKESGAFQVFITIAKVLLLIWFISGGLNAVRIEEIVDKFNNDIVKIGSTAGMVFITFFGFSAIAASAGEIKNPVKTIPRAILWSMAIVTLLYTFVVVVVLAAGLTEYTESALGTAAKHFLGPVGGMVIIAGALFSMISAANASIMAGSRVTLSMSRRAHLPTVFGIISRRTRTPIISLILVGGAIIGFVLFLPLEDLAHFADTILLLVLTLVNVALIYHRRKFPDIERPFKVPLVPILPLLGIIANLYLLWQILHNTWPVMLAIASLALGLVFFLTWKGTQGGEQAIEAEPSKVAMEQLSVQEGRFRILLPLANPSNVEQMMDLAVAMARERAGEILTLKVSLVPEQVPPSQAHINIDRERLVLDKAQVSGQKHGVPVSSLVRVGHSASKAILETSSQYDCDLILMGWKGFTSSARKIMGEITDAVVNNAKCDIMLVKLGTREEKRILLPSAGGMHAQNAERYILDVAKSLGCTVTVCSVIQPGKNAGEKSKVNQRLEETVTRMEELSELSVTSKLILHKSIPVGILQEAKEYGFIAVGAARESRYNQILFGTIPETIAKHTDCTVLLFKHYKPVDSLFGRLME